MLSAHFVLWLLLALSYFILVTNVRNEYVALVVCFESQMHNIRLIFLSRRSLIVFIFLLLYPLKFVIFKIIDQENLFVDCQQ